MNKREQLRQLLQKMRALHDAAEKEKRAFTDEEATRFGEMETQAGELRTAIEREERLGGFESQMTRSQGRVAGGRDEDGQEDDPSIGMSNEEVRQYSLIRAIRAATNQSWRGAELERDASEAVAEKLGKDPKGFFVPNDWLSSRASGINAEQRAQILEQRDLLAGTPSAGGHTVDTVLLASSFIELLRNRMVVRQAGATVLGGLVGDMAIPKQSGGATAYWVDENGALTESQQTLGQVPLTPHTVGAYTEISRKLMKQSSLDVEAFVRNDLATVLALAIDKAALHGTGSGNQPTGVAGTTGVNVVAGGTNGGAIDWPKLVALETEVAVDNADVGRLAYIVNARTRGALKTAEKASGTGMYLWGEGGQPLNGYPAYVSNQVRSDLTKGTGTALSAAFFGNWGDLLMGMWGTLDLLVNPYSLDTTGAVRVTAFQDVDIAVRQPESFAVMLDAITS